MHEEGFVMNQSGGTAFHELGNRRADYRFTQSRLRGAELNGDSDKYRILTLGDSFTFGLLLNEEDTYVHHLQEFADSSVFYNAAVGGSGLADWPGWLENYGEAINPDLVVLFLNTDDLDRALSKNLFVIEPGNPGSLVQSQRWRPRSFFIGLGRQGWYRWLQGHSDLMNILVKILWRYSYFTDLTKNFDQKSASVLIPGEEQFSLESDYSNTLGYLLLERLQSWCDINNCTLLVGTTGFFKEYPGEESPYTYKFYQTFKDSATITSRNIPFFNISPCVNSASGNNLDSIRITGDSHPNEGGSRIIADCTWSWMKEFIK